MFANALLTLRDGEAFATTASRYFTGRPDTPTEGRLLLKITIEGLPTTAAVDTGAPYLVCDPALSPLLAPYLTDPLGWVSLGIRRETYQGELYLLTAEIIAHEGEGVRVQATTFIPRLSPGQQWLLPSFIGWTGMLERLRFAVDPASDTFYFGPLS